MKNLILGVILGFALAPAFLYAYMLSGRAPVATSEPPLPLERLFASTALHARLARDAQAAPPLQPSPAVFLAGARTYRRDCAVCHGLPGKPAPIVAGMFPAPPQLFKHTVTDDPVGMTFWKVKNGIRLSGMPGFSSSLSDEQAWQVSLLLANADKLPADVQQTLTAPLASEDPPK